MSVPYIVKSGPVKDAIMQLFAMETERVAAYNKFKEKHGGNGESFVAGLGLSAIPFENGVVPPGWVKHKGFDKYYRPSFVHAREAYTEMGQLPKRPSGWEQCKMLGIKPIHSGDKVLFPGFFITKDDHTVVIAMRVDGNGKHEVPAGDVEEITMTKYYELQGEGE